MAIIMDKQIIIFIKQVLLAKEVRVPGENHSADNLDDKIDITLEQNNLYRVHHTY
jgi:hypothetical protein